MTDPLYGVMGKVASDQRPKEVRTKLCIHMRQFSVGAGFVPQGTFSGVGRLFGHHSLRRDVVC